MNCSRRQLLLATSSAAGLSVMACASPSSREPARPTLAELGIYSAGQGSAFLPYAQGLAVYWSARGLKTQALESTGSIDNIRKIETEPNRVATVFLGSAYEGITGTGAWTQGQKFSKLRALFPMYETSFQVVALRNTGISSIASLRGKRLGVGPAGGPAEGYVKALLEMQGITVQLIHGAPSALAADLQSGKIDALWQGAALPIPAIKQVADVADAVVFGLSEQEVTAMLKRFPFLSPASVAANTYRQQGIALQSVAAWNFVMAHQDLPHADAYWLTRTALSAPEGTAVHASAAATRATDALNNRAVAFHPGAAQFYKERGIALP